MTQLVIITGLSGSGKHSVVKAFEDMGFFCVDNLPSKLLPTFVELCERSGESLERTAVVLDAREPTFVQVFPPLYRDLAAREPRPRLFFFEASDEALVRRFSETRRPHPMSGRDRKKLGLLDAIRAERELMSPIRDMADTVIDTSDHTVHTLRKSIIESLESDRKQSPMQVTVQSFGFKHGVPNESDLVLDVRFLINPHFVPELRDKTGRQRPVAEFLKKNPEVRETEHRFADLLGFVVPRYEREGRSYLTVSIGCTGGKHRSVMMAEALGRRLKKQGYSVRIVHRDIAKK